MRELRRARSAQVEKDYGRPIGILVDLQGPKLRVGDVRRAAPSMLDERRDASRSTPIQTPGDATRVHLPHPEIFDGVEPGHTLLLDDGKIRLRRDRDAGKQRSSPRVEVGGKLSRPQGRQPARHRSCRSRR